METLTYRIKKYRFGTFIGMFDIQFKPIYRCREAEGKKIHDSRVKKKQNFLTKLDFKGCGGFSKQNHESSVKKMGK